MSDSSSPKSDSKKRKRSKKISDLEKEMKQMAKKLRILQEEEENGIDADLSSGKTNLKSIAQNFYQQSPCISLA